MQENISAETIFNLKTLYFLPSVKNEDDNPDIQGPLIFGS